VSDFTESVVEEAALALLESLGRIYRLGAIPSPSPVGEERFLGDGGLRVRTVGGIVNGNSCKKCNGSILEQCAKTNAYWFSVARSRGQFVQKMH
jgi:hypothetical protein